MLRLLQRLAFGCCLVAAATMASASAFVVAPAAAPAPRIRSRSGRGGTVMMAQRHYEKMSSRGEFLLKSALATGAFVPVVTGLRNNGNAEEAAAPAPLAPLRRDALLEGEEEQGKEGAPSLSWGPPLEYRKGKGAAMKEMREVIARFGGAVQRQEQDLLRVNFGGAQDLELRFTADGAVRTRVGQGCGDMRRVNLLGEELAAKGGWQVKGYPLCLDKATAMYA